MRNLTKLIPGLLLILHQSSATSVPSNNAVQNDQHFLTALRRKLIRLPRYARHPTHHGGELYSPRLPNSASRTEQRPFATNFTDPRDNTAPPVLRTRKQKRQAEADKDAAAADNFAWKVGKSTPKFVTTKMNEENAKPILTVFPPDSAAVYRSGRSRELAVPHRNSLARVVYYATLPDVTRYPSGSNRRYMDHSSTPISLQLNSQRSYDPAKAGKDFVTRVQSSIIDVRPRGDKKGEVNSTPTFTVIDANPTPYPEGLDRIMYPEFHQNMIPGAEKNNRHAMPYPYQHPLAAFRPHYPLSYYPDAGLISVSLGGSNMDKHQYHQLTPYQHNQYSSPYYHEVEKINQPVSNQHHNHHSTYSATSYYHSSPYPTRHNRFPADRYPLTGSSLPFNPLESSLPPQRPPPSPADVGEPSYPSLNSAGFGIDGPSTPSSLLSGSSFDLSDNLGPSIDHSSLDLDSHHRPGGSLHPLSFRNKFSDYGNLFSPGSSLGHNNKYPDVNGFNHGFPFKISDSQSFKPQFSQVSDWLTNKPSFDLSSFELDDFNAAAAAASSAAIGQDYHIKGTSSNSMDTSANNQNGTTDASNELNNTIITPFTSSLANSSVETRVH